MSGDFGARIIGFILTTFFIAIIYGLVLTTMDFMRPDYSPISSGRHAAKNVYGLFDTVTHEVKTADNSQDPQNTSVAHKIATPYAVTADLSALLGGKLELVLSSLFHSVDTHTQPS